jgi:ubiquinone/menaquinone biosynthesis C-methylase UbiE
MQYPDSTFDVVICCHVLEHIPDDKKAMSELFRVLRPGGWAVLQVPIGRAIDKTYEDASITDPKLREKAFGQHDHVRVYGMDYKERLGKAGFSVATYNCLELFGEDIVKRHALEPREDVYMCKKGA